MTVTIVKLWQADCDRCGWHTRQAEGSNGAQWVHEMAEKHERDCVIPSNCSGDKD